MAKRNIIKRSLVKGFKRAREERKKETCHCHHHGACGGGIYFLGFIGAAIYYIQNAATFGEGFIGFLKALVWPVFLVFKLLGL